MECAVRDDLAAYVDGELGESDYERVRAHVESCAECRAYVGHLRRSYAALEHIEAVSAPEGFGSRVKARVRRRFARPASALAGLAAAAAILAAIVFVVKPTVSAVTPGGGGTTVNTRQITPEEMAVIDNIDVLEDFDILSDLDTFAEFESIEDLDRLDMAVSI